MFTANLIRRGICNTRNNEIIDRIIRVDHAGELGADRIYAGQMAVLGKYMFTLTIYIN